jgi:hypothetical protein
MNTSHHSRRCKWYQNRIQFTDVAVGLSARWSALRILTAGYSLSTLTTGMGFWMKQKRHKTTGSCRVEEQFDGPSATHESGHFYFAQTGHSHFAAT